MTTKIRPFPELRAYAESEARARVVTFAAIEGDDCAPDGDVSTVAAVELRLLCDLTRPASRFMVCQVVADCVGDGWQAWSVIRAVEGGGTWFTSLLFKIGLKASEDWFLGGRFNSPAALAAVVAHLWPEE